MKLNKVITVIIIAFILIGGYIHFQPGYETKRLVDQMNKSLLSEANVFDRQIKRKEIQKNKKFTDNEIIKIPGLTRISDESIFISDFTDFSIYHYSYDGNLIRKIETGRGSGPGEIRQLMDFDISNDIIWLVDSELFRVSSFNLNTGEYINSFSVEKRPVRLTTLKNSLIIQWYGSEKLFSSFDFEGNEIKYFGELTENQLENPLSFDGQLTSNRNDIFVYVPAYASFIFVYNENGELLHMIDTPDDLSFPKAFRDGNISRPPNIKHSYTMVDSFISGSTLSVYTARSNLEDSPEYIAKKPFALIDIYDLEKGMYVRSIELPVVQEKGMPFLYQTGKYDLKRQYFFTTTAYEGNTLKIEF